MFSQRFPVLEQSTPKILSKTTFKFDKWSYKTSEDIQVKKQGTSVQAKRQKTQPNFKQIRVLKKFTQKTLYGSVVNPSAQQEEFSDWEQKYYNKDKECQELQEKTRQLQQQIEQLERRLLSLKLSFDSLQEDKPSNDVVALKKQMNQIENELKDQLNRTDSQLRKTLDESYSIKDKFRQFETKAKCLQQQTIHLHQSLLCKYCNKLVVEAVTIIPCAHTYCGACNKGYSKKCFLCGDESKIEATYYNQFMEEIVKMYDTFQSIIKIFLG